MASKARVSTHALLLAGHRPDPVIAAALRRRLRGLAAIFVSGI